MRKGNKKDKYIHIAVSLSVLLSCYIVIRDAGYQFYSCEIY